MNLISHFSGLDRFGPQFSNQSGDGWVEGIANFAWDGRMSSPISSEPNNFGFAEPLMGERGSNLTEIQASDLMRSLDATKATRRLRSVPGRETYVVTQGNRTVVVKATDGDLPRERWYDRFHGRAGRSPGQREFDNLTALQAAGFRAPGPLGWARNSNGRSLVVMDYVAHREDLSQRLERLRDLDRAQWSRQLAGWVARLHRAGFYHRDLYLVHFVLAAESDELVLLDVGRMRCEAAPRTRWFVKDLAALYHSRPAELSTKEALRFLSEYLNQFGSAVGQRARKGKRSELNRWARRVERKAQRLAAHRPKYVDSSPSQPVSSEGQIQA